MKRRSGERSRRWTTEIETRTTPSCVTSVTRARGAPGWSPRANDERASRRCDGIITLFVHARSRSTRFVRRATASDASASARVPARDRPTAPHCPPCARNLAREARPRRPRRLRRPRRPRMTFLERVVVEDALDSRKRASTSRKRVDKNSWRMTRRRRRGARARWVYPVVPCGWTRANARGMIASSR